MAAADLPACRRGDDEIRRSDRPHTSHRRGIDRPQSHVKRIRFRGAAACAGRGERPNRVRAGYPSSVDCSVRWSAVETASPEGMSAIWGSPENLCSASVRVLPKPRPASSNQTVQSPSGGSWFARATVCQPPSSSAARRSANQFAFMALLSAFEARADDTFISLTAQMRKNLELLARLTRELMPQLSVVNFMIFEHHGLNRLPHPATGSQPRNQAPSARQRPNGASAILITPRDRRR